MFMSIKGYYALKIHQEQVCNFDFFKHSLTDEGDDDNNKKYSKKNPLKQADLLKNEISNFIFEIF